MTVTTKPKGKTSKAGKVATETDTVEVKSAGSVVKSHRHTHAVSTNVAGYHLFKDKFWKRSAQPEAFSEEAPTKLHFTRSSPEVTVENEPDIVEDEVEADAAARKAWKKLTTAEKKVSKHYADLAAETTTTLAAETTTEKKAPHTVLDAEEGTMLTPDTVESVDEDAEPATQCDKTIQIPISHD